jgi:hypothetical protein
VKTKKRGGNFSNNIISGDSFSHNTISGEGDFSNNIIAPKDGFNHNEIVLGAEKKDKSFFTVKRILISIFIAVISGLIVWYLTHSL